MSKIHEMHRDIMNSTIYLDYPDNGYPYLSGINSAAMESEKVTEQIAIEFAEWLGNAEFLKLNSGNWTNNFGLSEYSGKTLFQEFLKAKQ